MIRCDVHLPGASYFLNIYISLLLYRINMQTVAIYISQKYTGYVNSAKLFFTFFFKYKNALKARLLQFVKEHDQKLFVIVQEVSLQSLQLSNIKCNFFNKRFSIIWIFSSSSYGLHDHSFVLCVLKQYIKLLIFLSKKNQLHMF